MFDHQDDPEHLQRCLESFMEHWHGKGNYNFGICEEKLGQTRLPKPLHWLFKFSGNWPDHYWETLFGNQDFLLSFEALSLRDGKLVFVWENQGVWQVGTENEGDDPPVWVSVDDGPWLPLDDSLTRFLVTFFLHETVFGCRHTTYGVQVLQQLEEAGMQVAPLWLNHPYPFPNDRGWRPISFHVVNGAYLVMDDEWCATNVPEPQQELPQLFTEEQPPSAAVEIPPFVQRAQWERAIKQHEAEAKFHQERAEQLRNSSKWK